MTKNGNPLTPKVGKILVTGGAGYIGAHTAVELIQAGYEITVIDNLSRSNQTLLQGIEKITDKKVEFIKCDCRDRAGLEKVFTDQGPFRTVMHFAALKSVGESVQQPLLYHENNVNSLLALLEVMGDASTTDFIFSSSCTVYGQPDHIPVDEQAPFRRAESPYGASKQICERILEDVEKIGIRTVSLRYFNPIGAHPSAYIGELPIDTPNNLVPYITQTAAGVREKLTIFGDDYNTPDGTCIRDYIHIVDLALAHVRALDYLNEKHEKNTCEAFNLGSGQGNSVLEVVKEFIRVTGVKLPYAIGPRRAGDIEQVYADPAKANKRLKWKTERSLGTALEDAWRWEERIRKIG